MASECLSSNSCSAEWDGLYLASISHQTLQLGLDQGTAYPIKNHPRPQFFLGNHGLICQPAPPVQVPIQPYPLFFTSVARETSAEWAEVGQCRTVTPSALPALAWWRYFLGQQEDLGRTRGSWGMQSPIFNAALGVWLCGNPQCGNYQTDSGYGKPCPMTLKVPTESVLDVFRSQENLSLHHPANEFFS